MTNNDLQKISSPSAGMNKDIDPALLDSDKGFYTHARNALLFSHQGNSVLVQNEPSNLRCVATTYDIIGHVALGNNKFAIFSTDGYESEIGIFDITYCTYTKVVSSTCLNFKKTHIVKGVAKDNFDCSQSVYFTDGLNPRRVINLSKVPYTYKDTIDPNKSCLVRSYTTELDCNELLVDKKVSYPKVEVSLSSSPGSLSNGSYQAAIAYTINRQRVTDFLGVSVPQSVFSHENFGRAVDATISNLDRDFAEYMLVVIYTINNQTSAEIVGYYSTQQSNVVISAVGNKATDAETLPLSDLVIPRPFYSTAEDVITSGEHLLWSNPSTRVELDYQKAAMNIIPKWVAYKVPADYYRKGGNIVGYMRDEVYAFYIQWLYDTGHWSPAYHIPGREANDDDRKNANGYDVFETQDRKDSDTQENPVQTWQVYNTAGQPETPIVDTPKNYSIIAEGELAFWESSETYPDNENLYGDFACKNIRHVKFPDNSIIHTHLNTDTDPGIIILGAKFSNITHPKDASGNKIKDIVGYRILRADRKNNKSVIAKGLLFNTAQYNIEGSDETYLYPNYPYNDLRTDPFLSSTPVKGGTKQLGYSAMGTYKKDIFTFHSPSTSFGRISLGQELKIETEESASVRGRFEDVYKHPRHKLIRDISLLLSAAIGVGEGILAVRGKRQYQVTDPTYTSPGFLLAGTSTTIPAAGAAANAAYTAYLAKQTGITAAQAIAGNIGGIVSSVTGDITSRVPDATNAAFANVLASGLGGFQLHGVTKITEESAASNSPSILGPLQKVFTFAYYFMQGTSTALNVIRAFLPFEQYAKQYVSHGFFNRFIPSTEGQKRRKISHYEYLYPVLQQVQEFKVNNFKRESSVIIRLSSPLENPKTADNTRATISSAGLCDNPYKEFATTASAYYASIKNANPRQYGQIDSPSILGTGYLEYVDGSSTYETGAVFGGDTYVNRFTQKRKMHYFNQFEYNERDSHEFDYRKYYNIPYAKYWIDTFEYDFTELFNLKLPNDKHSLDCRKNKALSVKDISGLFLVKNAHFYLFNTGVIDFYVESEYNLDYRDYEEQLGGRHYDPREYTDLTSLFRSDVIDRDNVYIYDKSLSKEVKELYVEKQSVDFNPSVATTCYSTYKNRIIYSLSSFAESKFDNWRIYLSNNYYDFGKAGGNLTGMRFLERGATMFFFANASPLIQQTVDTLQTDAGLKLSIGDGGLFGAPYQKVVSTDYAYGSCQSKNAFVQTQFGLFYPSQDQGKVFLYNGQLNEISAQGMSMWFSENLPSKLAVDFPNFPYRDNTVAGVGLVAVYDNTYKTYYLAKRDFRLKPQYIGQVIYDATKNKFSYSGTTVLLTNETFFENASWTVSYNLLTQSWTSFHDWHPNVLIQSGNHFTSIIGSVFYKHNELCNSYCNFYGVQRPFDLEIVQGSGAEVSILRSVEYNLECLRYYNRCDDPQHLLDYNFDQAIVYNTEQVSGVLKLNLQPKNKIQMTDFYPSIGARSIDIEYTKEENKYRFNQFWDVTNNRGEFRDSSQPMFNQSANGYVKELNGRYCDYGKAPYERKKFRHYWNKILFRKVNPENVKMIFKFAVTKMLKSFR